MKPYFFVNVVLKNCEAHDKINAGIEYCIFSVKLYYIYNM